jgi:hypothetical protein
MQDHAPSKCWPHGQRHLATESTPCGTQGQCHGHCGHWANTTSIAVTGPTPWLLRSLGQHHGCCGHWANTMAVAVTGPTPWLLRSLGQHHGCCGHWANTMAVAVTGPTPRPLRSLGQHNGCCGPGPTPSTSEVRVLGTQCTRSWRAAPWLLVGMTQWWWPRRSTD